MSLRPFQDRHPQIAATAYIDDSAVVIGAVEIGEYSSVWPLCVVRGDVQRIQIGARTSIQDGTVVHVTHDGPFSPGGHPTLIGDDVTVGHKAILHACTVENLVLIGMGVIVMDKALIQSKVIVGAGSVVPPGKVLESGYLYVGSPVKRMRPLTDREQEFLPYTAQNYVRLKDQHR
ncbi:MAG: gamma carbonic anhydrase family protein [Candidatus Competibacteraceae bacterium]|jgi:carbonic anhydrase/acetyltransferase-like protein (isoleucine patch superfamily)|nr:gamma carbonic anhydrase family protein [Candidatus Competibacteraceae bacterium]